MVLMRMPFIQLNQCLGDSMSWWAILKQNIFKNMTEQGMISEFAKYGMRWPSRSKRWNNLKRTVFMSNNPTYKIIYGRKGTKEEGKPIAAQGWAKYDGVYLGQGLRNPHNEKLEGRGYGTDVATEVFREGNRTPAILFANTQSINIYKRMGFKEGNLQDVKELSKKIGQNLADNIPDFHNWNEKLMVLI